MNDKDTSWENDFYEVLPIIKSNLTLDAKVARIKVIFEKLIATQSKEVYEEGLNLRREYNDPELLKELMREAVAQHDATYHPINKHNEMVKSDEEAKAFWQSEAISQFRAKVARK